MITSSYHVLIKPIGAACNLDCHYCFFLSKSQLYPGQSSRMPDDILKVYLEQRLDSREGQIDIAWQGGEPTLMGLEFFRKAIDLVEKIRKPWQRISHSIQTNGVLLDDEWCVFLKEKGFLVGLSIDGPLALHDAYRVDKKGNGSFESVIKAWWLLRKYRVETNILCCVHAENAAHPLEVYRFFRDELGATYLQFVPVVERSNGTLRSPSDAKLGKNRSLYFQRGSDVSVRSVKPLEFGKFLCGIFDEWISHDLGQVTVLTFEAALGAWLGVQSMCIFSPTCGKSVALENNGDVYSCDHFVEPLHLLGNIRDRHLSALVESPKQIDFGQNKFDSLPNACRQCDVLFACYGECPRNRFARTSDGEEGLNYLCEGYKLFFEHVGKPISALRDMIRKGKSVQDMVAHFKVP